ncbi:TetR/AcrR family transcriptional regulator [Actinophytocola oryzae]|uniref:TetR family transcriptional regulator n=1 Tax=Actinophytocola oryzae TaxID=502181 RepID=A0A4R7UYU3_9PSEU|nr:TetR/AcrR family transcriptional regulator [Actinophytocola oryzae]TDV41317.1 TetR family transcriptional regulator [Actinophytocola oryzae]
MADTTRPGRSRLRGPQRRAKILEAALDVLAATGYHATAMSAIAEAAGVTRSVLYDHFPNKRVLLLSVLQEQNAALIEYVGARITGTGAPEERMRATIDAYFSFAESQPAARHLLFDWSDEDDAEIQAVRWGIREARTRAVTALLSPDLRRIGLGPDSSATEAVVELLITGIDGLAQWWARRGEMTRDELVTAAMRLLWHGLDPRC